MVEMANTHDGTGRFTRVQVDQLLRPVNPSRVMQDGKNNSHLAQQDVLAHLNRIFGFGNWSVDVLSTELVFEEPRADDNGRLTGRWDVCYRATIRLTIRDPQGRTVMHCEDGSTDTSENQKRGDAHDTAFKSALSLAKKRAAIGLGDQFGLSLYNGGQLAPLVKDTLVKPDLDAPAATGEESDVQTGVPSQVMDAADEAMSHSESPDGGGHVPGGSFSHTTGGGAQARQDDGPAQGGGPPEGGDGPAPGGDVEALLSAATSREGDLGGLREVWREAKDGGLLEKQAAGGFTVRQVLTSALAEASQQAADGDGSDDDGGFAGDGSGRLVCGCDAGAVFATGAHQEGCGRATAPAK